jgi:hypothetical protein
MRSERQAVRLVNIWNAKETEIVSRRFSPVHVYTCTYTYTYTCIYMYMYERERELHNSCTPKHITVRFHISHPQARYMYIFNIVIHPACVVFSVLYNNNNSIQISIQFNSNFICVQKLNSPEANYKVSTV